MNYVKNAIFQRIKFMVFSDKNIGASELVPEHQGVITGNVIPKIIRDPTRYFNSGPNSDAAKNIFSRKTNRQI